MHTCFQPSGQLPDVPRLRRMREAICKLPYGAAGDVMSHGDATAHSIGRMLDTLAASGPHPDHASQLMLFGQFVGSWEVDAVLIAADGTRSQHRGEWHFGWVLEGRAIQDVLISPPRGSGGPAFEYGTTLRFYDPQTGTWQITWITPVQRAVRLLIARPAGNEIVLEGREPSGRLLRWTFSDIAPASFTWRGFISDDGGATWHQNEEMRLRRR